MRVQQQVSVLRGVGDMEEIQAAKQVLKEARSSRAVSEYRIVNDYLGVTFLFFSRIGTLFVCPTYRLIAFP